MHWWSNIHFEFTVDTLAAVIAFNIVGTLLQMGLNYIHEKKKWEWSDRALKVVNFLMSMIAIIIANKRHPLGDSESGPDKSKQ